MEDRKVSSGSKVRKPSAQVHNDLLDMLDAHKRTGGVKPQQPKHTPRNYNKVKVKNSSGSNIRRGDVLEFTDFLLDELEQDYLWFDGDTPDLTNVGWGIALRPIINGEIDECLCLGVCIAYVYITDEDHEYATRENGQVRLTSAATGPVKILHKPTGDTPPEERECVVQLMDEAQRTYIGKTDEDLDKGSTATVSRYTGGGSESDTGTNDEVKNLFCDVGTDKWVAYVEIDGTFYAIAGEME